MRLVAAAMTLCLGVVVARVAQLQLAPGERLSGYIQDRVSRRVQAAPRGDLLDRRGRILAATRSGYRIFVDPTGLAQPVEQDVIERLASVTGLTPPDVARRLLPRVAENEQRASDGRPPVRYVSLGDVLADDRVDEAQRLKIPGVHLERRAVREMPGGDAVAALVGKVGAAPNGTDDIGLLGAELTFHQYVQPQAGHLDYVRDAQGRPMWVEAAGYRPAVRGDDVRLSLDLVIQQIAVEELERGVREADAAGGRLVMVDPRTGDVLAMVDHVREMPGLAEPPARVKGAPPWVPDGRRYRTISTDAGRSIHPAMARNRCVEDVYEPGSTFKSFMWATVTERGLARPDEVFQTYDGVWTTDYGRVIRDVVERSEQTWADVLVNSSNIGMVQGTARLTHKQMRDDVLRFGFGTATGIGLAGESPGLVTPPSSWSKYTQTSVASGYEIAATPLQMVRAFCVFARNGDLAGTLPTLRLRSGSSDPSVSDVRKRVLPPWIAYLTRQTMGRVAQAMEERARRRFPDEPPVLYTMFGKSGTAEIFRPDGRGYFDNQYNSSFLAGAPAEDPRIVLVVVIDDPGPQMIAERRHYGSSVAGPVVRRVVRRVLEYMGVPPTEPDPAQSADSGEVASADDAPHAD